MDNLIKTADPKLQLTGSDLAWVGKGCEFFQKFSDLPTKETKEIRRIVMDNDQPFYGVLFETIKYFDPHFCFTTKAFDLAVVLTTAADSDGRSLFSTPLKPTDVELTNK